MLGKDDEGTREQNHQASEFREVAANLEEHPQFRSSSDSQIRLMSSVANDIESNHLRRWLSHQRTRLKAKNSGLIPLCRATIGCDARKVV